MLSFRKQVKIVSTFGAQYSKACVHSIMSLLLSQYDQRLLCQIECYFRDVIGIVVIIMFGVFILQIKTPKPKVAVQKYDHTTLSSKTRRSFNLYNKVFTCTFSFLQNWCATNISQKNPIKSKKLNWHCVHICPLAFHRVTLIQN